MTEMLADWHNKAGSRPQALKTLLMRPSDLVEATWNPEEELSLVEESYAGMVLSWDIYLYTRINDTFSISRVPTSTHIHWEQHREYGSAQPFHLCHISSDRVKIPAV